LDFIECEKPQGVGYCSDNECTCTPTPINDGQGYIYISEEVVQFRKDALSLSAVQAKIVKLTSETGKYVSISKYAPLLVCEAAAKKRNLDLTAASEDALLFWGSGIVPLRATPLQKKETSQIKEEHADDVNTSDHGENSNKTPDDQPLTANLLPPEIKPAAEIASPSVDYSATTTISARPLSSTNESFRNDSGTRNEKDSDISVDDVVAQYASGPLAEMAKRMAQGLNEGAQTQIQSTKHYSTDSGKDISNSFTSDYLQHNDYEDQIENVTERNKSKAIQNSGKNGNHILVLIIIPLIVAIMASVVVIVFKLSKLNIKPSITNATPPPVEETPAPMLNKSFFLAQYTFEDNLYEGTIAFSNVEDNNGRYLQNVRQKGKTRIRTVNGAFSFTEQGITFHPDGYSKNIVWVLEEINQSGSNAVFLDPLQENRETTKVYLKRKE